VSSHLPGRPTSLWVDTAPETDYPRLQGEESCEVVVIGAGITGLATAAFLDEAGIDVTVLEAGRVARGATGYTTAKLSSLHGLIYTQLRSRFGEDGARTYGEANQAGLERIVALSQEGGIDCDLRRRANYTFAESPQGAEAVEQEASIAAALGLPASFVTETPLPFPVAGAVRFADQAEFHPRKFAVGLAERLSGRGCDIFERSPALQVNEGNRCRVETAHGAVTVDRVVVATHFPFLDRGLFFARMHPERSYSVAVRIPGAVPDGMFITASSPTRSIRAHPVGGGELLLVGGEGHKVGQGGPTTERYRRLVDYARERFDASSVEYRWSTQDNITVDGAPYIGPLAPRSRRIYTATGFRKWGLAQGVAAAMILADALLGRDNPWASFYDSNRFKPLAAASDLIKENANVGFHFFADRLTRRARARPLDLEPGQGKVVSENLRQIAVSRNADGDGRDGGYVAVSARCTHMGCIVNWNDAERTWDCPCHGSRFAPEGAVLQGPAVRPLEPVAVPGG
jgi:glycine/D-amino acid oxidase-like deaminating enzyme/nitrite reductase/ring-hydroxylating ferredoxin subunit